MTDNLIVLTIDQDGNPEATISAACLQWSICHSWEKACNIIPTLNRDAITDVLIQADVHEESATVYATVNVFLAPLTPLTTEIQDFLASNTTSLLSSVVDSGALGSLSFKFTVKDAPTR